MFRTRDAHVGTASVQPSAARLRRWCPRLPTLVIPNRAPSPREPGLSCRSPSESEGEAEENLLSYSNAGLGRVPGHCVSITHVPFPGCRTEEYGLSDGPLVDRCVPAQLCDLKSFPAHELHGIPEDRLHISDFHEHARSESALRSALRREHFRQVSDAQQFHHAGCHVGEFKRA